MVMVETTRSVNSFEEMVKANIQPLYNIAMRLVRRPHEAEDLVQETLLRAFRFFDRYEPGSNFKAWLFKILKNCFINRYRKSQKEPDTIDIGQLQGGLDRLVSPGRTGPGSSSADPEKIFMEGVLDEEIELAIRRLPADHRMVLIMAVIEEMSYKEIAQAMSSPIGTVMSRLHRARRTVQANLLEYATQRGLLNGSRSKDRDGSSTGIIDIAKFKRQP